MALSNGGRVSEHPLVVRIGSRYFDGDCGVWQSSQGMTFIIRRYTVDSGGINFTARDDILSEKITLAAVVCSCLRKWAARVASRR